MSIQVFGLPVSRGVAIGRAVLIASSRIDVAHYFIDASQVGAEIRRLAAARDHPQQTEAGKQHGVGFRFGNRRGQAHVVDRAAIRVRLSRCPEGQGT